LQGQPTEWLPASHKRKTMGKNILITGVSSGLGKRLALTLASEGHRVIGTVTAALPSHSAVAQELAAQPTLTTVVMDITQEESVTQGLAVALRELGHLDVLVNNAGVTGFGLVEATSVAQMQHLFEVNLFGAVRTSQAVLPGMRQQRAGLIINFSSGAGLFALPYSVPYAMAKFGLEAFTEGLRQEVQAYGIEVVAVLPGAFATGIGDSAARYGPDRPEVATAYGPAPAQALAQVGATLYGKVAEYGMEPQEVADAVSQLIARPAGTRPFHTSVNRITDNVEQEYVATRQSYFDTWMRRMGLGI
jgi:NAD(P)-dependent dehydrogenase (short-subunit alcohol dehydrogenase family)